MRDALAPQKVRKTPPGFGLKCDDACSIGGPWQSDAHAWQRQLVGWSGIACLVLSHLSGHSG
jgi:hypothetical protein